MLRKDVVAKMATDVNRYTADTAKKTGKSERSIQREAARGAAIPDVAALAGTSLDKGDELDALAKLPADEQRKLAERAKAGEKGQRQDARQASSSATRVSSNLRRRRPWPPSRSPRSRRYL